MNPAAFAAPAPGRWGTAGRNSVTGPAQFALNAGITRTFPVGRSAQPGLADRRHQRPESRHLCRRERAVRQPAIRTAESSEYHAQGANHASSEVLSDMTTHPATIRVSHEGTKTRDETCFSRLRASWRAVWSPVRSTTVRLRAHRANRCRLQRLRSRRIGPRPDGLHEAATAQTGASQQIQADATPQQPVFRSGTRLVVETVSVKDKDGKPIEGLTREGFHRSPKMASRRRSASWSFSACRPRPTRRRWPRPPLPASAGCGRRAGRTAADLDSRARRHPLPRPPADGACTSI